MSRGGRGGFGRGGGRAGGGSNMPPMGLSFQELGSLDKTPSKLYPEPPTVPRMERPDDKEIRYASYQLMYLEEQKTSPYWPVLEQRKQGDLTRFSDRYRPESQDLPSLKSINLQKQVFPNGLWDSFMERETKREEHKGKFAQARCPTRLTSVVFCLAVFAHIGLKPLLILTTAKKKARRKINWDSIDLEDRAGVSAGTILSDLFCCKLALFTHLAAIRLPCFLSLPFLHCTFYSISHPTFRLTTLAGRRRHRRCILRTRRSRRLRRRRGRRLCRKLL